MPDDDREIYLTPDTARRVANAVRVVERMPRSSAAGWAVPRLHTACYYAIVTEEIGAGDQATKTLGHGKGRLQLITATTTYGTTTYTYDDWPGPVDVLILNGGSSVGVGRLIQVKVIDGYFNVDVDYC